MTAINDDQGRIRPIVDAFTEPFWSAAKAGRLMVQEWEGQLIWPPRMIFVAGEIAPTGWHEVSGHGSVFTYSVIHRSSHDWPAVPYILAVVRLDEGLHMTTNIVDCTPGGLSIGLRVAVRFEPLGDLALPVFAPL
jgi:uncharacterized OB-fold protein